MSATIANASRPSADGSQQRIRTIPTDQKQGRFRPSLRLMIGVTDGGRTNSSNDLRLYTQLILISASDPTDSPILPNGDIRRILDLVPHVPGCECQNKDHAEHTPDDPRLDQGEEVVVCLIKCETANEEDGRDDDEWDWVEWPVEVEGFGCEG